MGLFKKREVEEITPPVSDVLLSALMNQEAITREKALTLPAVAGAVDFISNAIACMPVKLYKTRDGRVEELSRDPRVKLLNGDTGDTLDAFQLKKAMVEDYLLGKGGYCYVRKDRNDVIGLFYVEDRYITILKNYKPIFKNYEILVEGNSYHPWEFVKLLRNTKDGASGVGLTVEVSKALETAYQTLVYQLALVKSGGSKRGFLKSQRKLAQAEIDILKSAWRRMYSDTNENVVVLNNGIEFQEASNSSVEMQLDQNKRTLQSEIDDIFHIYRNDFDRTFKEAIYPIIRAFETALNRDLLLEKEKKNHYWSFDTKEIIKASLRERYESYKMAKETGFITVNEIRSAENMESIDGMDVINVGLGAVLYDISTHTYYTPNTDTVASPNDDPPTDDTAKQIDTMLEDKEMEQEFEEDGNSAEVRFNENHGADGKFTSSDESGGGNGDRIKELEAELSKTSRFGSGAQRRKELQEQINALKGDQKPEPQKTVTRPTTPKPEPVSEKGMPVTKEKEDQFKIIQETNPMTDDVHTGIRQPSDIKSAEEAFETTVTGDDYLYPDFTQEDGRKALETGKVTVYSSKPIDQGGFVSPSKMMAQDYAGGGKVYSKEVSVDDVAWIDSNEGQFAKRFNENNGKEAIE